MYTLCGYISANSPRARRCAFNHIHTHTFVYANFQWWLVKIFGKQQSYQTEEPIYTSLALILSLLLTEMNTKYV